MKKISILIVLSLIVISFSYSQVKDTIQEKGINDTIRVAVTRDDYGNMIPWIPLMDAYVNNTRIFLTPQARSMFNRLRYNVLKVLPYAKFARNRYSRLNEQLAQTTNKREQRKLVKVCEKEIKDMFNKEIKNMTITQGEILIKLIDRETGNSSYELVKELKGGFTAFCYQSVARVFGHNLKQKYDPQEDRDIENVIVRYGYYGNYLFN
ncbi:DUF4294 domain-containing protein [Arcticibacter eurypsychrophilus]|uniref:DUF4294 domain-containing protein n=1 Tax=Arcticibacter eurypsychrophilus TaxID=1434752 RepID=UPI00084D2617|nr:DUF4294 domain-containing protein [Arcticibacter eurypsychrophilus]